MESQGLFHVEAGQIAAMERSLGSEAAYRQEAVAPLTFTQASAHEDQLSPLRPHPRRPWKGSGRTETGVDGGTGNDEGWLHAEQHFEYRRHPRAGECLHWKRRVGSTWSKSGSSGVLNFREEITEFVDDLGQVVVTSRIVRVQRVRSTGSNGG